MQKQQEVYGNTLEMNNIEDSKSFKSKIKITGKTPDDDNEKDVEIMVP